MNCAAQPCPQRQVWSYRSECSSGVSWCRREHNHTLYMLPCISTVKAEDWLGHLYFCIHNSWHEDAQTFYDTAHRCSSLYISFTWDISDLVSVTFWIQYALPVTDEYRNFFQHRSTHTIFKELIAQTKSTTCKTVSLCYFVIMVVLPTLSSLPNQPFVKLDSWIICYI